MAAPETDEPRIIDLEEGDLWQDHKGKVMFIIAITLIVSLGGGWWYQRQSSRETAAWAAYAQAKSPEARAAVLQEYPGSSAAATALLQLAKEAATKKDYATASGYFAGFLKDFSKHPSRPVAEIGQAETTEAAGDPANADKFYRSILAAKPAHPYQGAAALGLARILKAQNKTEEARGILEDYVNTASQDPFFNEARRALSALPPGPSAEVEAPRPPQ